MHHALSPSLSPHFDPRRCRMSPRPHISGWRFQQLWNGSAKSFAHSQQPSEAQLCPARPLTNFKRFQQISTLSSGLPDANRRCFFSMLANCGKLCRHRQFQYLLAIAVSSAAQVMARWSSQLACMWWPVAQIPTG